MDSEAADGNYAVTAALINGNATNFVNFDEQTVAVDFAAGNVEVATPDADAPVLTKLTATINGSDQDSSDSSLSCTGGGHGIRHQGHAQ